MLIRQTPDAVKAREDIFAKMRGVPGDQRNLCYPLDPKTREVLSLTPVWEIWTGQGKRHVQALTPTEAQAAQELLIMGEIAGGFGYSYGSNRGTKYITSIHCFDWARRANGEIGLLSKRNVSYLTPPNDLWPRGAHGIRERLEIDTPQIFQVAAAAKVKKLLDEGSATLAPLVLEAYDPSRTEPMPENVQQIILARA